MAIPGHAAERRDRDRRLRDVRRRRHDRLDPDPLAGVPARPARRSRPAATRSSRRAVKRQLDLAVNTSGLSGNKTYTQTLVRSRSSTWATPATSSPTSCRSRSTTARRGRLSMTRRRLLTALAAAVASALAVVALATAEPSAPEATGEAATGALSLAAAAGDTAILSAVAHDARGRGTSGTVTIRNTGEAPGTLLLTRDALHDPAGPDGGRLGETLRLRVEEVGGASLYTGPLAELAALPVGSLAAGRRAHLPPHRVVARRRDPRRSGVRRQRAAGRVRARRLRLAHRGGRHARRGRRRHRRPSATPRRRPSPPSRPHRSTGRARRPRALPPVPAPSSTTPPAEQGRRCCPRRRPRGDRLSIGRVGLRARDRVAIRLGCPTTCRVRLAGRLDDGRKHRARVLQRGKVLRGETVSRVARRAALGPAGVPLTPRGPRAPAPPAHASPAAPASRSPRTRAPPDARRPPCAASCCAASRPCLDRSESQSSRAEIWHDEPLVSGGARRYYAHYS